MSRVTSPIAEQLGHLEAALSLWAERDDSKAQPDVRQAANVAIDAIDTILRDLYSLRSQLATEIRASDDATAVRVDALLAEIRKERQS